EQSDIIYSAPRLSHLAPDTLHRFSVVTSQAGPSSSLRIDSIQWQSSRPVIIVMAIWLLLLGQVFSQHPSVFYLMEPAWHVWTKLQKPGARTLRMAVRDLLRSVFQCASLSWRPTCRSSTWFHHCSCGVTVERCVHLRPAPSRRGTRSATRLAASSCVTPGRCRVWKTPAEPTATCVERGSVLRARIPLPAPTRPQPGPPDHPLGPRPAGRDAVQEESAKAFMSDNAIVLEQRSIPTAEVQYQVMQEICRSHVRINERAILKPPPFLKGRYKMVRYEDLARNPLEEINSMYEFVGLEMTKPLEDWIYRVTHGKGKGTRKEAFKITSRNAADVSQAWRTMLPHGKVKRIQEVCKGAMSLLGYRTVNNEKEQKRLDIDLLVPREPYQFSWLPAKTEHPGKS
uniref:Sulfotransferase n=1 Tax=Sphaeramia orbicularis TaxID=375764 RepID=A0A673CPG8_9TELE